MFASGVGTEIEKKHDRFFCSASAFSIETMDQVSAVDQR